MGKKSYEKLFPGDSIVYKSKYYWVSTAHYVANNGMQIASLIRVADIESNRRTRPSIKARADECKIICESEFDEVKRARQMRGYLNRWTYLIL